jgi:transcriptional regulator with XRE-family HTH domain
MALQLVTKPILKIKAARLRMGLRQLDLAYKANVPVSEVSRYETGQSRPYPSYAERLATVLGLKPEELTQAVEAQ